MIEIIQQQQKTHLSHDKKQPLVSSKTLIDS